MPTGAARIFGTHKRTDSATKRAAETMFEFLDRVEGDAFGAVRVVLDSWFARYEQVQDAEAVADLLGRLRSASNGGFDSGFWELYLHEIHSLLGYSVRVHPATISGQEKPDFLIEGHGRRYYLEAASIRVSDEEAAREKRESLVIELIEQAYHPDFALMVKSVTPPTTTPSARDVVPELEAWLNDLDWLKLRPSEAEGVQTESLPRRRFEVRDGAYSVDAWPKPPASRADRSVGTIWTYPPKSFVGPKPSVARVLAQKARHYGELDAPLVIALSDNSPFGDAHDIEAALYGDETMTFMIDHLSGETTDAEPGRDPAGGLYRWEGDGSFRRVAGVLSAHALNLGTIARVLPTYWPNPWALSPETLKDQPWHRIDPLLDENRFDRAECSKRPNLIFGLPDDWPGEFWRSPA